MQYAYESGSAPLQTNFYYEENGYNSPKQQGISQQRGQQSRPLWNPRQGQPNPPSPQSRGPVQPGYSQIMAKPHQTHQPQNPPGQVPAQQFSQAPIQYQNPQGPLVHNQQQARPAQQVGCYRCGSHEHYASSCPKPSKAQALLKEAQRNLDIRDFHHAEIYYEKALFVHERGQKPSEALKGDDLEALYDISRAIKEYHAQQKKNPTPVPATLPVLHTECYDKSTPNAPAQDLMIFNENLPLESDKNVPSQQDFLSGV